MSQIPEMETLTRSQAEEAPTAYTSPLQQIANTYHETANIFEQYMGMSRASWGVLRRLDEQGALTQAVLTQQLRVDAAAVTRQVKQLEREGLVTRWSAPEDNRYTLVALTEAGQRYVATKRPRRSRFDELVLDGLTADEVDALARGLAHIRRNLGNVPLEVDPPV
jgi:DNA-binding MarR family transcriptional regulator